MADFDPDAYLDSRESAQPQRAFDPDTYLESRVDQQHHEPTWADTNVKRPLGLAGRAIVEGVAALPMMAANAGVAARNLIGNAINRFTGKPATPDYDMPSDMLSQSLDQVFPHPHGIRENVIGAVESGLTGAALPSPTSGIKIPGNFQTAAETERAAGRAAIERGQQVGLVVPPATTNPTRPNKVLESISGKIATQQAASLKNQPIINSLAKQSMGLSGDAPLTEDAINYVKAQASNDYEAIRDAGTINMSGGFKDAIDGIVKKFNSTADELPSLADKDLQPIADELKSKDQFSANALLGAIRSLRTKANMAFRQGNGGTGAAYKQMATAIENAMDEDLSSRGAGFEDLVANFRDARQRMAIADTVADAFNPGTGNVVAGKLASALKKGAPLSGPLKLIAEFAQSAPKAVQEPTSSAVSHLDIAVPALTSLTGKSGAEKVSGFSLPIAREAARKYLMSGWGQAGAIPQAGGNASYIPRVLRAAPGTLSSLTQPPEAED